ncbi:hypothetical protein TWF696_009785 [Orbilia brochopaga]|uniref:Uncharacterized protein n=1 Tax=Orbilia brochopaga TaxID=3140254 RepID=A0AAV9UDT8_9PEZI
MPAGPTNGYDASILPGLAVDRLRWCFRSFLSCREPAGLILIRYPASSTEYLQTGNKDSASSYHLKVVHHTSPLLPLAEESLTAI